MRRLGLTLTLLLAAAPIWLRAQEAPAATPPTAAPKVSAAVTQSITAALPKYSPPKPVAEAQPANAPNPDVIELPKMKVSPKQRPRLTPDISLTTKAFNEKLARDKLSSFDRDVLNRYTLPLFGTSAADRAREEYERAKKDQMAADVQHLAQVAEAIDPAQAKAMRQAIDKP